MIRVIKLGLRNHPFLKNIDIPLVDLKEINNVGKPYTSVVIGINGTGKSQILKIITEVFQVFRAHQNETTGFFPATAYGFSVVFKFYHNIYEISSGRFDHFGAKGKRKVFECYKYPSIKDYQRANRFDGDSESNDLETLSELSPEQMAQIRSKKEFYSIYPKEIELPSKVLASAIFLNDRFTFADSKAPDFYQYLGPRREANALSTMGFIKKVVRFLFDASVSREFKVRLGIVLRNLGFRETFVVQYYPVYKKQIYQKKDFSVDDLHNFFTNWREMENIRRSKERELWGFGHYNAIKKDSKKLESISALIRHIAVEADLYQSGRKARFFQVDVFGENDWELLYNLDELIKLDLIHLNNVFISKNADDQYQLQEVSSGEYNILFSMLAMFSRIENDSVVLIDEPEISLHPNWQMRYIDQLKTIFQEFSSCHFIVASHSHFIVSDLEGNSSSVTSLKPLKEPLINRRIKAEPIRSNTFGWSAEEVLYKVFDVKTTRNYYIETDLRELLHLIAIKSEELDRMRGLVQRLNSIQLSENDPLKEVLRKANQYIGND